MTTEELLEKTQNPSSPNLLPQNPPGKLIVEYLHDTREGATLAQIVQHLRSNYGKHNTEQDLIQTVEKILENGTALGFLERKGSHYVDWQTPKSCGCTRRRRQSRCGRRRRRKICRRYRARRRRRRRCYCS